MIEAGMIEAPVQGLWIGPRLSTMQQLTIRSWLANGHPFHLYTYEDVAGVPPGTTVIDGREVLPASEICFYRDGFGKGSPSLFSNFFRYRLLLDRGGYWSDMDMVCLKPLRFVEDHVFGQQIRDNGDLLINCALMKAPAGSPVMRRCWALISQVDRDAARWGQTGPQLIDHAVRAEGLERFARPVPTFYPISHRDIHDFVADTTLPPEAQCVHLWGAMWKHKGLDADATHAKDSLYERLKARYPG